MTMPENAPTWLTEEIAKIRDQYLSLPAWMRAAFEGTSQPENLGDRIRALPLGSGVAGMTPAERTAYRVAWLEGATG